VGQAVLSSANASPGPVRGKGDVAVQSANKKFVFLRRLLLNEQILRE
jgi:hypothetical protein